MALPATPSFTAEEYLALERAARNKHEFYDGYIVGMSGASRNHNRIQSNLIRILGTKMIETNRPCWVAGSDLRVKVSASRFFYPDVTLICGPEKLDNQFQDNLENPAVVIEILSESTESYDRIEKVAAYHNVASLQQCVLINSATCHAEVHTRKSGHLWDIQNTSNIDESIIISEISLFLKDIYFGADIR